MHNHFIGDFFEMITYRGFQEKTLKDFIKIIDDEHSLYVDRTFKKSNRYQSDVFHKNIIKRYFDKTDNNNGVNKPITRLRAYKIINEAL